MRKSGRFGRAAWPSAPPPKPIRLGAFEIPPNARIGDAIAGIRETMGAEIAPPSAIRSLTNVNAAWRARQKIPTRYESARSIRKLANIGHPK